MKEQTKNAWLQIRVNDEEKARAESVANEHGVTVSELVRALVVMASENDGLARRYTNNGS